MCYGARQRSGLTLIEMTLVVATIALLVGFALPAVRALVNSFQSEGGTRTMIDAALSSARAVAVNNQRYVGIRFPKLCSSGDPLQPLERLLDAPQYMILVMHEEPKKMGNLTVGFRAVEGLAPIKLPSTIGVMDVSQINSDADIDELVELNDATAFSIVFSPSGKLVVHEIRARNREGRYRPNNDPGSDKASMDDVFNSSYNIVKYERGMFIQDDYSRRNPGQTDGLDFGLGQEASRTSFVIYDRQRFRRAYERKAAWTGHLLRLAANAIYVSPYTGNLISSE
jgi:type II secretory pathway pseudopilin PulG